jgi:geranylgeranyl reductase family protein
MIQTDTDVIIAGAGPAGSIAAYLLAKEGISCRIIEKETFPRYKVCGGGLTHKILKEIPYSVQDIIETSIHSVRFSHKFQHPFTRTSQDPFIYCTMRSRLDAFMVDKAVEAGSQVSFGEQVTGLTQEKDRVVVITKKERYPAKILIEATGAGSVIARAVNLRENLEPGLAWEAEIKADEADINRYANTVFLDWGTFPGGYAWVFPKNNHFSIGVGGPASMSKWMMPYYEKFVASTGINFGERISLRSWPIPVRMKPGRFHSDRVMVTGDAAGLTDPLTGEGIYYAIRSGALAAEACINRLKGQTSALEIYSGNINREIMPELMEAIKIRSIFNAFPFTIHKLVRDNDRVWGGFGKILRGERNYQDVRKGFGKWQKFWKLSSNVSKYLMKPGKFRL